MIKPPSVTDLHALLPLEPLLMMGAGPVPIPARVAAANSIVINHLGDTMARVIDQMKSMARYVFQTASPWVLGVAGPASAAMEMAVCNLVNPGDRVLSICNGYFGQRFADMAQRAGGVVQRVEIADGLAASVVDIQAALERFRPAVLTIAHGETSTTTLNFNLAEISKLAKHYGCLVIVDAVCTISTMPFDMDAWLVDVVVSGGQKGLSSIPGVSLIAFSEPAWERIQNRRSDPPQWCLDAKLAAQFWHNASYHYTAPVSGILALHEALHLICSETLTARFARHLRCSIALQVGIEAMGLSLFAPQASRLNSVVGINLPSAVDPRRVCKHISENFKVEIAGSFGLNIVRIGQMGEQCREHNLFRTLHALGQTMKDLGAKVDVPTGIAELERELQRREGVSV